MNDEVKLIPEEDFEDFLAIVAGAFPEIGVANPEVEERMLQRFYDMIADPTRGLYGHYRDGLLQGGMILYDFSMNVHGLLIPTGGVGLVAVHLLHRKEHVAKEMMTFFMSHYRERQAPLLVLYPFRPDFYRKMGFGYGTKRSQYTIRPRGIQPGQTKSHIRYLNSADLEPVRACYNRLAAKTHGMIMASEREIALMLDYDGHYVVGYDDEGICRGFLTCAIIQGERMDDGLSVGNFIYEDQVVLSELLSFLHSQKDQFRWITITTHDDTFQHLLTDPRDKTGHIIPHVYHQSNVQGVGLMYRVLDVHELFRQLSGHNFGGVTCRLALNLTDTFVPSNSGRSVINFVDGKARPGGDTWEVVIDLDVSEFSSLVMGVISLKKLYQYGLVKLSDPSYLETINQIFWCEERPICLTRF